MLKSVCGSMKTFELIKLFKIEESLNSFLLISNNKFAVGTKIIKEIDSSCKIDFKFLQDLNKSL